MKYEAILFDLDGTLLPMDNDKFTKGYFSLLAKAVAHLGYTPDTLIPAMWKGVKAMVLNDGAKPNADAFWKVFSSVFGEKVYDDIPVFDDFYRNGFHNAKDLTFPTDLSKKIVDLAHKKAERVIVATNPFFPAVALQSRLSWIGLKSEDFDLVTDYENSHFCKPNPNYYKEILDKFGLKAQNCLMVGNNIEEDIIPSSKLGFNNFLVTDWLLGEGEVSCPKGSLKEFYDFLKRG